MVEAVYRILNIGLAVTNLPLENISMNNDKVFFVVYNLFNDFRDELSLSTFYFVNNFILKTNEKTNTFIMLLAVSAGALILGVCILFPALNKVNQQQLQVLSLFLDMPDHTVKQLHIQCEQYLTQLTMDDDSGVDIK
jgi:hypothetical protein